MKTFPNLVLSEKITELQDQFNKYQTIPMEELPNCASDMDIEIYWGGNVKAFWFFLNKSRFDILSIIAKTLLV